MNAALVGGLVAGGVILCGLAALYWWRKRQRSSITDALAAIALERIQNVLVPDGMGGEIHIEHLLLTASGILVVDVKPYEGVIFASELMDPWTAMAAAGRSTFANPLGSLYDRVAAVRQLIPEIDVIGFVVFPAKADFSKGRPEHVMLPDDLLASYAKPDGEEVGRLREAFAPYWEKLSGAVQPAAL